MFKDLMQHQEKVYQEAHEEEEVKRNVLEDESTKAALEQGNQLVNILQQLLTALIPQPATPSYQAQIPP